MSGVLIGIDGGGTHTTLAVADAAGRELIRRDAPPGLVDPRDPDAAAEMIAQQARDALAAAGQDGPAAALCAGLAGVGDAAVRDTVRAALERARIAARVLVTTDGEAALEGSLGGGPGILLISGTGSIAYARGEDGRVERCGGWGMVAGDQGSGYWIGRESLVHALRAHDGRGRSTPLLSHLLRATGLAEAPEIPRWLAGVQKAQVAALAREVLGLAAEGDPVSNLILDQAARDLADHAAALFRRLSPWTEPVAVVLHGGLASQARYALHLHNALRALQLPLEVRPAMADAVTGALRLAAATAAAG